MREMGQAGCANSTQELTVHPCSLSNLQLADSINRLFRAYRWLGGWTVHESVHGSEAETVFADPIHVEYTLCRKA
jgi:hypothetical protein